MKISEWTEWDIEIISDTKSEIRFDVQWQWQFALLSKISVEVCAMCQDNLIITEIFPSPKIMDQDWELPKANGHDNKNVLLSGFPKFLNLDFS